MCWVLWSGFSQLMWCSKFLWLFLYFSVKIFLRWLWSTFWICGSPRYLYVSSGLSSSISFYFLCWFSTLPLLMFVMVHLSKPKIILMSLLKIFTVSVKELYSLSSSMYRRCAQLLLFCIISLCPISQVFNSNNMGFKAGQNYSGENQSPQKIPFLITVPAFLLFTHRFVHFVLIMSCRTFLIFGQILCIFNTFINQWWGTKSDTFW